MLAETRSAFFLRLKIYGPPLRVLWSPPQILRDKYRHSQKIKPREIVIPRFFLLNSHFRVPYVKLILSFRALARVTSSDGKKKNHKKAAFTKKEQNTERGSKGVKQACVRYRVN